MGECVLLGVGAGRCGQLDGIPVRILGHGQLDHGRQAPRLDLGDGPVGQGVRPVVVEPARPASADGRGLRGTAVPGRAPVVRAGRRASCRDDSGTYPYRGPDVPLQQPRRPAGPTSGCCRLRHGAGDRGSLNPLDRLRGRPGGLRVPDQEPSGVPRSARVRADVPHRRPHGARQTDPRPSDRVRRHSGGRRLVGSPGRAVAGRLTPLHRRVPDQQRSGSDPGLQRPGAPHRRRSRQRRARRGRRRPRWRQRRGHVGRDQLAPHVRRLLGRRHRLAAARRAGTGRGRLLVHAQSEPCVDAAGRPGAVDGVAAGHPGDVLVRVRDHPRVLRGRTRPGHRCPGGPRRHAAVEPTRRIGTSGGAGGGHRRQRPVR